jgi:hypothetical protein
MSDLREQLDGVADKIRTAYREVGADDGASPVLEQAGDSAKAAAEADPGVGGAGRQAVLEAHLAICMLKATM